MTKTPSDEHLPKPADLQREARRLERLRRLTIVPDPPRKPAVDHRFILLRELDPDPKEAA